MPVFMLRGVIRMRFSTLRGTMRGRVGFAAAVMGIGDEHIMADGRHDEKQSQR